MKCLNNIKNNLNRVDNFAILVFNIFTLGIMISMCIFLIIQFIEWSFSYASLRMILLVIIASFIVCKINSMAIEKNNND